MYTNILGCIKISRSYGETYIRTCVYMYIYIYILYGHQYKLFSILTRLRSSRYKNSPTNMYTDVCFLHDSDSLKIDRVL